MILTEFSCEKIKTSFKTDLVNFPTNGYCTFNYNSNSKILNFFFKKKKDKIYFDDTQDFCVFSHTV